ncbi:MAG: LamB/YcsF family protein [Candidatus Eremiobacteraeota bacterium]|nr:LamB/YcsF family protein [Candidatus Eremiobacteraeota bacterium]
MREIDLNADLGEGCGDDNALMTIVTSANIACGAHAGDEATMRETIRLAQRNGVAIGAHPSFPDRENFGRIDMQRAPHEIYEDVRSQIETLATVAREEGAILHHVKAHGALYNLAARDVAVADAISRAVADASTSLIIYGLAGGAQIESAHAHGLRTAGEGFADRRYEPDGTLVPRSRPNALINDEEEAVQQALALAQQERAQTICLHGDGPHAIAFARRIRDAFARANITIRASQQG